MSLNRSLGPRREDYLYPIEDAFNKFFDDFFSSKSVSRVKNNPGYPKLNIEECDGEFIVTAALPGMRSDDVSLEVSPEKLLTISGRMASEYQSPEGAHSYVRELKQSMFRRTVALPENLEGEPEAVMKDGILKLTWKFKRVEPKKLTQTIRIRDGDD